MRPRGAGTGPTPGVGGGWPGTGLEQGPGCAFWRRWCWDWVLKDLGEDDIRRRFTLEWGGGFIMGKGLEVGTSWFL